MPNNKRRRWTAGSLARLPIEQNRRLMCAWVYVRRTMWIVSVDIYSHYSVSVLFRSYSFDIGVRNYGAARSYIAHFVHCCILLLALLAASFLLLFLLPLEMYTLHIPLWIYDENVHRRSHWHRELKRLKQQNFCTILLLTHSLRAKLASDIRGANISVKYTITEWNCKLHQVVAWHGIAGIVASSSFFILHWHSSSAPVPSLSLAISLCRSIILFRFGLFSLMCDFFFRKPL